MLKGRAPGEGEGGHIYIYIYRYSPNLVFSVQDLFVSLSGSSFTVFLLCVLIAIASQHCFPDSRQVSMLDMLCGTCYAIAQNTTFVADNHNNAK